MDHHPIQIWGSYLFSTKGSMDQRLRIGWPELLITHTKIVLNGQFNENFVFSKHYLHVFPIAVHFLLSLLPRLFGKSLPLW